MTDELKKKGVVILQNNVKIYTWSDKAKAAGILTIEQIQKWQEEHLDVKLEDALAPLKDLDYDANPVVVIVEP